MCRPDSEGGRRCPSHTPTVRRADRAVVRAESEAATADERVASLYDATPEELDEARRLARAAHRHVDRAKARKSKVLAGAVAALAAAGDKADAAISSAVTITADAADNTLNGAVAFVAGTPAAAASSKPRAARTEARKPAQRAEEPRQETVKEWAACEASEALRAMEAVPDERIAEADAEAENDWLPV